MVEKAPITFVLLKHLKIYFDFLFSPIENEKKKFLHEKLQKKEIEGFIEHEITFKRAQMLIFVYTWV